MTIVTGFEPDWASPPGDTIADALEERGWSPQLFAEKAGISLEQAKQIISGAAPIDGVMAYTLSRVLGSTTRFWIAREANYRARLRRFKGSKDLKSWVRWLEQFPILEMMKSGLLPKRTRTAKNKPLIVEDLLRFFSVASPSVWKNHYEQMEASFRCSNTDTHANLGAISAWLRAGERVMEKKGYSPNKYNSKMFKSALHEIRNLTTERPESFGPKMMKLCSEAGVNLVLIPSIPRARVSGVARWINSQRPLIQLSLYGKTNDRFWFTFFHESAHIILHKEKQTVFLDSEASHSEGNRQEQEADEFSANMLIPKEHLSNLRNLPHKKTAIQAFSRRIGIHPGIVVGRMQHERKLPYRTLLNDLKTSFILNN